MQSSTRRSRLLRAAARDDPYRSRGQGHRLVRRAAGPRHGRGQRGLRVSRPGDRPQVRHAHRQSRGRGRAHAGARGRRPGRACRRRRPEAGPRQPRSRRGIPAAAAARRGRRSRRRPRGAQRSARSTRRTTPMVVGTIEEIRLVEPTARCTWPTTTWAAACWCSISTPSRSSAAGARTASRCRTSAPTTRTTPTLRTARCRGSSRAT